MDRGKDSVGVVQWARKNKVEVVRGNHDDRYLKYHEVLGWHGSHPGNTKPSWAKKYPDRMKIYTGLEKDDLEWLASTPMRIWFPDHNLVAVHAGFKPGVQMAEQENNSMMHIRFLWDDFSPAHLEKNNFFQPPRGSIFWAERYSLKWNVVYGHHVWSETEIKIHTHPDTGIKCYGIDTGCCFGGRLTALIFDTPTSEPIVVQQQALEKTREH